MEATEGVSAVAGGGGGGRYTLKPAPINNEDILFCVDVDAESLVEMKTTGADGKPFTRLEAIRSAILLFINSKLTINPDHRFAFATLSKSVAWLRKEFSGSVESAVSAIRMLSATSPSSGQADLTNLFRIAAHEAKKSRAQNRILRVILIYCRSSTRPQHQPVNQKLFTLDVMYLHDKPGSDNCPQAVYDALVEALENVSEYEGYIYESGQGIARILFRYISVMLAHPQQRCPQEFMDTVCPKSLTKKTPPPPPVSEPGNGDGAIPVSSQ